MFSRVVNFFKSVFTSAQLNLVQPASPNGSRTRRNLKSHLTLQYRSRVKMELDTWRMAVESAENITMPRRDSLYSVYRQAMEDETLLSEIRKAHIMMQRAPFIIQRKGKDSDDMTELLKKPFFKRFLGHWLDTEFWGHTVVEFLFKDGEVDTTDLFPREHVRPETGEIVLSVNDSKGIAFDQLKQTFGAKIVAIGEPYDLGLLKVASHSVITKRYSESDWSQYNEKYGSPMIIAGTQDMNDTEADNMELALQSFGSSGYVMPFNVDQIKLLERTGTTGYKTYEDFISRKENNLAKLINGQTGTSDEKSFVGAAQVHERVLNDYTFARLSQCQDFVNFTLLPFLIENGYPFKKWDKFVFTELVQKANDPQTEKTPNAPTDPTPNDPNTEGGGQKKKPQINERLHLLYTANTEGCCALHDNDDLETETLAFDWDKLFGKAIDWVFKKKEKANGKIHVATWRRNVTELTKGVNLAFDTEYKDDDEKTLHQQLKSNAAVFAAFKNYVQNKELVAALTDDDGNVRSFGDFKKVASGILTNFNVNYLKTEYQTAVASAQMAVQWQDFQRAKEDFPLLRYVTVGDDRVRASHKILDGVTLPIEDDFWKEWFPPNNWNCRCDVQQVGGNNKKVEAKAVPTETPAMFKNNAGLSGKAFTEEHPYYDGLTKEEKAKIEDEAKRLLN